MADSYLAEGIADRIATFDLTCRALPRDWGYLLAAGLDDALTFLQELPASRRRRGARWWTSACAESTAWRPG